MQYEIFHWIKLLTCVWVVQALNSRWCMLLYDAGWMYGSLNGIVGLFPEEYVRPLARHEVETSNMKVGQWSRGDSSYMLHHGFYINLTVMWITAVWVSPPTVHATPCWRTDLVFFEYILQALFKEFLHQMWYVWTAQSKKWLMSKTETLYVVPKYN